MQKPLAKSRVDCIEIAFLDFFSYLFPLAYLSKSRAVSFYFFDNRRRGMRYQIAQNYLNLIKKNGK
jgi:hypothetical protein